MLYIKRLSHQYVSRGIHCSPVWYCSTIGQLSYLGEIKVLGHLTASWSTYNAHFSSYSRNIIQQRHPHYTTMSPFKSEQVLYMPYIQLFFVINSREVKVKLSVFNAIKTHTKQQIECFCIYNSITPFPGWLITWMKTSRWYTDPS